MKRKILILAGWTAAMVLLGFTVWYKLMRREVAQPAWVSETRQNLFLYGSVGANEDSGIPYWVWLTMPRIFPEHMPGNGGYVALGSSWEEGREMPAGFAKQRIGYLRVTGNCALCHAASYRVGPNDGPEVVAFVPGRAGNVDRLREFFKKCAEDPRFNSDEILTEVKSATRLQWSDYLLLNSTWCGRRGTSSSIILTRSFSTPLCAATPPIHTRKARWQSRRSKPLMRRERKFHSRCIPCRWTMSLFRKAKASFRPTARSVMLKAASKQAR